MSLQCMLCRYIHRVLACLLLRAQIVGGACDLSNFNIYNFCCYETCVSNQMLLNFKRRCVFGRNACVTKNVFLFPYNRAVKETLLSVGNIPC